jgi:hypothetical protein
MAHEVTHALDRNDSYSTKQEWLKAWQKDMQGRSDLRYPLAAHHPDEGLAHLGEFMLRDRRKQARKLFPECCTVWEDQWKL